MFLKALTMAALLASTVSARAEWVHIQGENDPFKGGPKHDALFADSPIMPDEMFGFSCNTATNVMLIWVTRQKVGYENREYVERMRLRIALIVDGAPPIYAKAKGKVVRINKLGIGTDDRTAVTRMALAIASATKGVAAGIELNGKIIDSTAFPLGDAPKVLGELVQGCHLKPDLATGAVR